jgi:hypothetical protein
MTAKHARRPQEAAETTSPSNLRWFKLYEALAEFGSALAYPCRWNDTTNRWQALTDDAQRRRIYSTIEYVTGDASDFVPCWYNARARRWEVISKPSSDVVEVVQLNHASATAGDIVEANASGFHAARIKLWNGAGFTNSTAIWLLLVDYYDVDAGAVIGEQGKYYGPAKFVGTATHSADTRPLYLAKVGNEQFIGKPDADIAKAASGAVSLWHRATEADSNINKTCQALAAAVTQDKYVVVNRTAGQWYVGCWEAS